MEGTESPESAVKLWETLERPWQAAFHEAWESWRSGNFGIGAVLVDPETQKIVATGRNRVAQPEPRPRMLTGNMTAHAEMNAFAALDRFNAQGLHLYTTVEPCLMCAATAMQLKLAHVHFATRDGYFDGIDNLWSQHPVTAKRQPQTTGPFDRSLSRLGHFARLLPLIFTLQNFPDSSGAVKLARATHPELATIADNVRNDRRLIEVRAEGSIVDGLTALWDQLPE